MNLYFLSLIVVVVNPISAMMLAFMVVHLKSVMRFGVVVRFFLALMVVGLLVQAAEQVALLQNYRPPRAHGWIATMGSLNGVIWAAFIRHIRGKV